MGCGETLVKYLLFISNLVFSLAGLGLVGLGLAVQLHIKEILDLTEGSFQSAPIACMVVGGIVFFIAFFGCCGAIKENNCMLVSYSIFLLVLIIIKIALAVLIFMNLGTIMDKIPSWFAEAFTKNQDIFHEMEKSFHCCGPTGSNSYGNNSLPIFCCPSSPCTSFNAYSGCDAVAADFIKPYGIIIGVVAIIVVCIEIVTAVFGSCLASYVRNNRRSSW